MATKENGPSLAYPWELCLIDDQPFDAVISETHTLEAEITEYPVESGSVISDNIRRKPISIQMECIVSNTPIGAARKFRNYPNATETFWETLKYRFDNAELVTVRSTRGTFKNMAIKSLSVPRDSGTGDAMRFTLSLQQLNILDTKRTRVAIPIATRGKTVTKTPVERTRSGAAAEKNAQYEGSRLVVKVTIQGRQEYVWFDQTPRIWRRSAFITYNPVTHKYSYTYVRGAMLDNFMGSDTQMRDRYNATLDKNGNPTKATQRLLPQGYPPWGMVVNPSGAGNPGDIEPGSNFGRITDIDGTPGLPDIGTVNENPVDPASTRIPAGGTQPQSRPSRD